MESREVFTILGPKGCPQCCKETMAIVVHTNKRGHKEALYMRCKNCGAKYPIDWTNPKHPRPLASGLFVNSRLRGFDKYM